MLRSARSVLRGVSALTPMTVRVRRGRFPPTQMSTMLAVVDLANLLCHKPRPMRIKLNSSPDACSARPPWFVTLKGSLAYVLSSLVPVGIGNRERKPRLSLCRCAPPTTARPCSSSNHLQAPGSIAGRWLQLQWCFLLALRCRNPSRRVEKPRQLHLPPTQAASNIAGTSKAMQPLLL